MSALPAKFDITQHLRDKVREVLINSIPEDNMDAMLQAEIKAYFHGAQEYGRTQRSSFSVQVEGMLQEIVQEKVRVWLDTNFEVVWGQEGTQKLMGEVVAELIPVVQQKYMADMVSRILGEIRTRNY